MKLVVISDTHGGHQYLDLPGGDLLIHAGDVTPMGSKAELQRFDDWLADQPHPHKVVVAGNHDFVLEEMDDREAESALEHATYLKDRFVEIEGVQIWGSPWTPDFHDWAFMLPRGDELEAKWNRIPPSIDVLVTHGPPHGILDETHDGRRVGCRALRERVFEIQPDLHVFGHIHEARGEHHEAGIRFVNASLHQGESAVEIELD
jgi:Icc-related predicted phosphoesterase